MMRAGTASRERRREGLLVALVAVAASACSVLGGGGSVATADCGTRIRSAGVVFTSSGFIRQGGTAYGTALESVCEDVGKDARGSVFTDESRRLTVFRFAGYPPSQVLGARSARVRGFEVFVADTLDRDERDRIFEELGLAGTVSPGSVN